jgi:hypothetical protein
VQVLSDLADVMLGASLALPSRPDISGFTVAFRAFERLEEMVGGIAESRVIEQVPAVPQPDDPPPRLTPAILDILRTLKESKVRLTRGRLLSAMTEAGRDRGASTVADAMPTLRKAGWVDNEQKSDPRGFAITKAGRSALKQHDARCL